VEDEAVKAIVAAAALAVAAAFLPGQWLELRPEASLVRIVTCHFTHWSHEQLAWDALAFTALGVACARRNARATHATLLASVLVIPVAVLAFAPEIGAYRGLSGLASAMFALLLTLERRRFPWLVATFAVLFAAKLTLEAITGGAVFANDMGDDVITVPVAHLAGALLGMLGGSSRRVRAAAEQCHPERRARDLGGWGANMDPATNHRFPARIRPFPASPAGRQRQPPRIVA
jgi:membrane associated rhomboid family serine protease